MSDYDYVPTETIRYSREQEGRCVECGAFDGPTHRCPTRTHVTETPYGTAFVTTQPGKG